MGGGLLGSVLCIWGIKLFMALAPRWLPQAKVMSIDARVLGFTLAITIATGILFSLAPALRASKTDLNDSLAQGGRTSSPGSRHRTRTTLVVVDVALALVLLVSAGLTWFQQIRVEEFAWSLQQCDDLHRKHSRVHERSDPAQRLGVSAPHPGKDRI
jgi:hypothetical protein